MWGNLQTNFCQQDAGALLRGWIKIAAAPCSSADLRLSFGTVWEGAGGSQSWSYSFPQDNAQRHKEPICEWLGPLPLCSLVPALKCHLDYDAFTDACIPPGNILGQISPETQHASLGNCDAGTSQLSLQAVVSPQGDIPSHTQQSQHITPSFILFQRYFLPYAGQWFSTKPFPSTWAQEPRYGHAPDSSHCGHTKQH